MLSDDPNYKAYNGTEIKRGPDHEGSAGAAWHWNLPDDVPNVETNIDSYLICVPGSHPFWWWYMVAMIDLREHVDTPSPHKQFPTAEYEIQVVALNPEHPVPEPEGNPFQDPANPLVKLMQPSDQVLQIGPFPKGDDDAREMLRLIIKACVDGYLVPDQDHRQRWAYVVGNTYEHMTTGGHRGHSHD